jgi:hypothetical protein
MPLAVPGLRPSIAAGQPKNRGFRTAEDRPHKGAVWPKSEFTYHLKHDPIGQARAGAPPRRLVAGVAHEINTPIGAVVAGAGVATKALEMVRKALEDPEKNARDLGRHPRAEAVPDRERHRPLHHARRCRARLLRPQDRVPSAALLRGGRGDVCRSNAIDDERVTLTG